MIADSLKIWRQYRALASRESRKSALLQLWEIMRWRMRGFNASEYYMYPLYAQDPRPTLRVRDYVAEQKLLNPMVRGVVPVDKWVQSLLWRGSDVPHAHIFGFIRGGRGLLLGTAYEGEEALLQAFFSKLEYPVVVKPMDGANGRGFDFITGFEAASGKLQLQTAGTLQMADFLRQFAPGKDGILFQAKILQHPQLSAVFAPAVNSLRVITHVERGGHHKVLQAMIKFGAGEDIIDNAESGVLAMLDPATGRLGPAMMRFGTERFSHHPGTGAPIEGVELPYWREALALAVRAHRLLPYPRHLGWDIAIAEDGPLVIEMNSFISLPVNQKLFGGPLYELQS